jgi:hypothetical protein
MRVGGKSHIGGKRKTAQGVEFVDIYDFTIPQHRQMDGFLTLLAQDFQMAMGNFADVQII